jgi:glycosyltransferase involved in cell wall biosynthesis
VARVIDVSVIIPTFHRPVELREAIASVLRQTGVDAEILVIDDCAEGSARRTVDDFGDDRVRYLKNPAPSGGLPSVVRNLGWPQAQGKFVHFLDDDDLVPDGHYAAVNKAFALVPGAGVVFGRITPFGDVEADVEFERGYFDDAGRRAAGCHRFGPKWAFAARMFFQDTLLVCSAAVVRRECLEAIRGFDPLLRVNEDVDFYARTIRRFGAQFIDQTCLYRRVGPSLIRQADVQSLLAQTYKRMHANYRAEWGTTEFLALKGFARTVLKVM